MENEAPLEKYPLTRKNCAPIVRVVKKEFLFIFFKAHGRLVRHAVENLMARQALLVWEIGWES